MIFDGLSRRHALRLCDLDHDYFQKHKSVIAKTVFTESYTCARFSMLIVDTIKKTHQNLAYTLRSFYKHGNHVYDVVNNKLLMSIAASNPIDVLDAFQSDNNTLSESMFKEYFLQVYTFIIKPVLVNYGFFSANIVVIVFVTLYTSMMIDYASNDTMRNELIRYYKSFWKTFISRPDLVMVKMDNRSNSFVNDAFKEMVSCELKVWCEKSKLN